MHWGDSCTGDKRLIPCVAAPWVSHPARQLPKCECDYLLAPTVKSSSSPCCRRADSPVHQVEWVARCAARQRQRQPRGGGPAIQRRGAPAPLFAAAKERQPRSVCFGTAPGLQMCDRDASSPLLLSGVCVPARPAARPCPARPPRAPLPVPCRCAGRGTRGRASCCAGTGWRSGAHRGGRACSLRRQLRGLAPAAALWGRF